MARFLKFKAGFIFSIFCDKILKRKFLKKI